MRGGPEEHYSPPGFAREDLTESQHLQEATYRTGNTLPFCRFEYCIKDTNIFFFVAMHPLFLVKLTSYFTCNRRACPSSR